jgi:hypothetical protein
MEPARSIRNEARRLLRSVASEDAATGEAIDGRVEDLFTGRVGSPSRIGSAAILFILDVMAPDMFANAHREALRAALTYGYWLRVYAENENIAVPPFPLPPMLPLTPTGGIDYPRWEAQNAMALAEGISEYGNRDDAFGWMPIPVLNVMFTGAAIFIHSNVPMRGRVAKAMNVERTAGLVRWGYAVRGVELSVGEPTTPADWSGEPDDLGSATTGPAPSARERPVESPHPFDSPSAPRAAWGLKVDQWIFEATLVCADRFEPEAEYMLDDGTRLVLGLDNFGNRLEAGRRDSVPTPDLPASRARFGYALRNWECQKLPVARELRQDPLEAELDELEARPSTVRRLWLPALLYRVVASDFLGGVDELLERLPGTTAHARLSMLVEQSKLWPEHDSEPEPETVRRLLLFGYLLHRVYEVRPALLEPT